MKTLILFCLATGLFLAAGAEAQQVYRWVDDNGEVHYSETLPPDFEDKKHDVLDSRGITRQKDKTLVPPPPKPMPKNQQAKELPRDASGMKRAAPRYTDAELKKQQNDLLLLRYDTDQEIIDAMEVEISQLGYDRRLLLGSRSSMMEAYLGNIREAAERQRAGKPVEEKLVKQVQGLKRRLENNWQTLSALKQRENDIRAKFEAELTNYRELLAKQTERETGEPR